jgi:hypothetical protein
MRGAGVHSQSPNFDWIFVSRTAYAPQSPGEKMTMRKTAEIEEKSQRIEMDSARFAAPNILDSLAARGHLKVDLISGP